MKKAKKEIRTFLKVEFKYDSNGRIHFINPSCDDIKATDFVKIMEALSKIENKEEQK